VRGRTLNTGATGFHPTGLTLGWEFTLSSAITVIALGVYDLSYGIGGAGLNLGLGDSHAVGIFSSTGTLLVSATVVPGGSCASATNDFCWVSAAPNLLTAGTYRIGAYDSSLPVDTDWILNNVPLATLGTASPVTYVGARITDGGVALADPAVVWDRDAGVFGPNLQFTADGGTAVPEPGSASMVAAGVVLLVALARRQ